MFIWKKKKINKKKKTTPKHNNQQQKQKMKNKMWNAAMQDTADKPHFYMVEATTVTGVDGFPV